MTEEYRINAKVTPDVTERIQHITDKLDLKLTHVLSALLLYTTDEQIVELTKRFREETSERKKKLRSLAKFSPEQLEKMLKQVE